MDAMHGKVGEEDNPTTFYPLWFIYRHITLVLTLYLKICPSQLSHFTYCLLYLFANNCDLTKCQHKFALYVHHVT